MLWHFLSPRVFFFFFLLCGFYAYVQMILILSHGKKFNLFFIKVQPLPCQSNPFISLSMDCSSQPVITVYYLANSLLIIPTSEKLPFVNYIATNEAQMHSRRCPLWLSLSLSRTGARPRPALASERHYHRSLGFGAQPGQRPSLLGPRGDQVYIIPL